MYKMKIKKILVILSAMLIMIPLLGFTANAQAYDDEHENEDLSDILIPVPIVVTHEHATASPPLTPQGNLTLVDDVHTDGIDDKQFITVETKNGHYFYIVVDRAGNGNANNVHFLSLVDELALIAILDDDVELPEPRPTPDPFLSYHEIPIELEEDNATDNNSGSLVAIVIFLALSGGAAAFYFKVLKPKQQANSGNFTTLDELQNEEVEEYVSDGSEIDTSDIIEEVEDDVEEE